MNLFETKVLRPFKRSLIKAMLLLLTGAVLCKYSKEWGSFLIYFSLGSAVIIFYYLQKIRKNVIHGNIRQISKEKYVITTPDGLEIYVPISYKKLLTSCPHEIKEIDDALLTIGVISCKNTLVRTLQISERNPSMGEEGQCNCNSVIK